MIIDFRYIIDSGKVISFRTGDVSYGGNDDDVIADWLPATEKIKVKYVDKNGAAIDISLNQTVLPPFRRSQIPSGMTMANVNLQFNSRITRITKLKTTGMRCFDLLFFGCSKLDFSTLPKLDMSEVTKMVSMFSYCTQLTTETLPALDTSKVTNIYSMFRGCTNLKTVPPIVAPNCTVFENMFLDCPAIQEVDITTPAATNIKGIFRNCSDLRRVKNLYTGKATAVNNFFSTTATDYKLTEIPTMNFSSCMASNTMNGFFVNRKGIRHMDITGAIHRGCTFYSIFDEDTLVQILQACNRTATTYGKKMAFKDMQTLNDTADGQYAALMAECTAKGWTFTNFTINPYETTA